MLPIWRLALNTLAGRRTQSVLMLGAVWLASCLIVAVSCAFNSARSGMETRVERFIGAADARIIHPGNGRFDDALLDAARTWPDVALAAGRLGAGITLFHVDRREDPETGAIQRLSPRAVGVDFALENQLRPFQIEAGRLPSTANEILIDPMTRDGLGVDLGQQLEVFRYGPVIQLTVVGVYERQRLGMLQRPVIYMNRDVLAEATDRADTLTSIYFDLVEGTDVEAFCTAHAADLPEPLTIEPAEKVRAGFDQRVRATTIGLAVSTVLAFMCTAFIILTGLTSGVTERQRELALLRCLGARRAQIFASQLLVGLAYGVVGAALGIPGGIAMTWALVSIYREYLPDGLRIDARGIALAVIGSIGAGVLGAAYPAWSASRVTPLRAMAAHASPVRRRTIALTLAVAALLIGTQLALSQLPDRDLRYWAYAIVGLPLLFTGWFIFAVPLLVVLTNILARPLAWVTNVPVDLLRGSVLATPFRHGFTSAALMLGMALLVGAWSGNESIRRDWLERIQFADSFASRSSGIAPAEQQAIRDLPFVESLCPIGYLPARVIDQQVFGLTGFTPPNVVCVGFDPRLFFSMNAVDWIEGEPDAAIARLEKGDGIIVADRFLVARGLGVGDSITLGVGRTRAEFEIVGVVRSSGLDLATQLFGIRSSYMEFAVSCCFMDYRTVGRVFDNHDAIMLQINLDDAVTDDEVEHAILDAVPGIRFYSGRWILKTIHSIATGVLAVQTTIAFAALVLASIAVGNIIAADVRRRRFEFGVIRAIGGHRGRIIGLILGESSLMAINGAVVGTLMGAHLAWMDTRNMRDLMGLPVSWSLPVIAILMGAGIILVLAMLAALPCAIRLVRDAPAAMVAAGRNE